MAKIEMTFGKDEFRMLVKLLYTGYYVCDRGDQPSAEREARTALVDRFLQSALTYRVLEGIEYSSEHDEHFLDADHEEALLDDYEAFIEDSFWDELVYRLGRRDFEDALGADKIASMEDLERITEEEKYLEPYRKEFESNGLARVTVRK
jgi:hypothetical protein